MGRCARWIGEYSVWRKGARVAARAAGVGIQRVGGRQGIGFWLWFY